MLVIRCPLRFSRWVRNVAFVDGLFGIKKKKAEKMKKKAADINAAIFYADFFARSNGVVFKS